MNSEGKISVYDFERIGYGWRAYEIASYIGHIVTHRVVSDSPKLFSVIQKHLLEGYESILPLSNPEKESLPDFYLMRRIWMNRVCCDQFINWGSSFLSISRWKREIQKLKSWQENFSR